MLNVFIPLINEQKIIVIKSENIENHPIIRFDYQTENNLYFLYYEIGGFSFHKPISEVEAKNSGLSIVEIDENFKTYGRKLKIYFQFHLLKRF